ncbi:thiamine pyrophosphate-binding protein [Candidatus Pelagibacter sp.]|nr:thiamine pyrophosphate-binding protein [Candidatus Pelagibacter sp.]
MAKIKLADYVIKFYANHGVDKMFVVYGAANGDLIDAFSRTDNTDYVAVLHEQAGGFAAEGYAKVKGNNIPGVTIATSGPGGMNLVTPAGNCYYDSVPVIFITGQVNSQFLRPDSSIRQVGFQETDQCSIFKSITKYSKLVLDPKTIKYELEYSLHLATSGRPGPILLDIPIDVQKTLIEENELIGFTEPNLSSGFDEKKIDEIIKKVYLDFQNSKRPVFLIGGGVRSSGAINELENLGNLLQVPMYPTWNALDIVTSDYKYYAGRVGTYGGAGRNFGIQNSDLLISIGSRVSGRITGGNVKTFAREAKKYIVDIDKSNLKKKYQQVEFDENLYCDAKLFINRFIKYLEKTKYKNKGDKKEWTQKCLEWKKKYDPVKSEFFKNTNYVQPYAFIRKLSEKMGNEDVFVADCGGNIVTCNHSFETKKGQRYFTNNGNSPMGFSFSGAIGAYFADPTKRIVCIIGDGGMNMNIQELQTIKNYNINIKTLILNNHIYGITKAFQETNFEGQSEACGPKGYRPPNFINIAKAYEIKTIEVKNNSELDNKIDEILNADEPIVVDINCHEHHTYEPRIFGWKTPIEDMYPYINRKEFKDNMTVKPVDGWENPIMPNNNKKKIGSGEA